MNTSEENVFINLAQNYDEAGFYCMHILNTFKNYDFPHKPLVFSEQQNENIFRSTENIVNLENIEPEIKMNIYPNPTDDEFKIEYNYPSNIGNIQLSIININGKLVYFKKLNKNEGSLILNKTDLGNAGNYQCVLKTKDNKYITKKIIVID
jgi:hypothetical protein